MLTPKIMSVLLLIVLAFGVGVVMGWDSGVRDAQHLEVCNVQC